MSLLFPFNQRADVPFNKGYDKGPFPSSNATKGFITPKHIWATSIKSNAIFDHIWIHGKQHFIVIYVNVILKYKNMLMIC